MSLCVVQEKDRIETEIPTLSPFVADPMISLCPWKGKLRYAKHFTTATIRAKTKTLFKNDDPRSWGLAVPTCPSASVPLNPTLASTVLLSHCASHDIPLK